MARSWYRNGFLYLLILVALVAMVDGLFGVGGDSSAPAAGTTARIGWLEAAVAVVLGAFAAEGAHEVGHVILGLVAGFRPVTVSVWPVEVTRTRNGVRLRWASLLVPGPVSAMLAAGDRVRRRAVLFCSGGLLGSLLAAGGGLWLCFGRGESASGPTWATVFVGAMGAFAAAGLILSVVDLGSRETPSTDGMLIRMFNRSEEEAERWCAVLTLQAACICGVRPRDWNAALVSRATSVADGSRLEASGCLAAYRWAVDRGDLAPAAGFLGRALSASASLSPLGRQEFLLEAACFEACYGQDPGRARALYDEANAISQWITEPHVDLRAEAAVLLAEGNYAEAADRAQRGLAAATRARREGTAEAGRDWLANILATARSRLAAGTREA